MLQENRARLPMGLGAKVDTRREFPPWLVVPLLPVIALMMVVLAAWVCLHPNPNQHAKAGTKCRNRKGLSP